jgi:purine catabolism regulator
MISEAYQSLLDSDKHEGTEYIATLRSFFAHNHSVTDTAKYLYIHRNTVNYRLNRIRERLKDDFNDPLVRLNLQLCILASDLS